MQKKEIPADKIELYNKLVQKHPKVERKGKTTPYTSMNGHMFSFLDKDGKMGLRLSAIDLAEFLQKYDCEIMVQHGRSMKEYAEIPAYLLNDTDQLSEYFTKSITYVSGLKPKNSKKK